MKSGKEAGRFAAIWSPTFRRQPISPLPFRHRHFAVVIPPSGHFASEPFRRRPLPLPARFVAGFGQRVSKGEVRLDGWRLGMLYADS